MEDVLHSIITEKRNGRSRGIPSFCTANGLVIEALLEQGKRYGCDVLIEATANQVNQFGGYTGMKPADFRDFVFGVADRVGFPREKLILGGDHLGPLTWAGLTEAEAMEKARELVRMYVLAGYTKIHLDTSMRLGDDPENEVLRDETIARRGAVLYEECEDAYKERLADNPAKHPVFIIGSEVPIPGGTQEAESSISVTKSEAVEKTLSAYHSEFNKRGLTRAFDHIIGIVVQPGVEFGDNDVFQYDRTAAAALCTTVRRHPGIVMEGHSTDYQSPARLREMVEDGISILKVGPALTFFMREGLFALSMMEKELIPKSERADLIEALEQHMLADPSNWEKHYHGTESEITLKRKYSLSDRSRYYMANNEIQKAIKRLFSNMNGIDVPMGMLHQYLPRQYEKVRDGLLEKEAAALVRDCVAELANDYYYAVGQK